MTTPGEMAGGAVRLVPVPRPEREMSESEMKVAFGTAASEDPLWRAVNQVLINHIVEAAMETCAPGTAANHGSLAHGAGGMEWLGRFQAELNERFNEAHQIKDEQPGKVIV